MQEEDFIKLLRENKTYLKALSAVNKDQAKLISNYVENWVRTMSKQLLAVADKITTDDAFKEEFNKALIEKRNVVINEED